MEKIKQFYQGEIIDAVELVKGEAEEFRCEFCSESGCDDTLEHEKILLDLVLKRLGIS